MNVFEVSLNEVSVVRTVIVRVRLSMEIQLAEGLIVSVSVALQLVVSEI